MAKLGSEKNPLILTVPAEEAAEKILAICEKIGCKAIVKIDPSAEFELSDLAKKIFPETVEYSRPKLGRNALCHCGSALKYKKCHWESDQENEEDDEPHIFGDFEVNPRPV